MKKMDPSKILLALETIGQDKDLRGKFIDLAREVEQRVCLKDKSVRDELTAPIVDALHSKVGILKKEIKPGLVFKYKYTSKMARELVMSIDAMPDHVWEPQTTKVLLHFCKDIEHVIIGGGYVGDQAVIVAKKMERSGGLCHVFELNPESYKLLEMNAKDNGLDNIKPNNLGLWSDDSSSLILVGEDDISAYPEAVENAQIVEKQAMPTVSINSYGEKQGIECLGLLMLDIEGGEFEALKGADRYLAQPIEEAPVVVFEVHRHYCDWSRGLERTPIIEYLKKFGYYFCAIRDYQAHVPMEGRPVELIPLEKTVLEGPPHGFNLIGVKDKALLENDLFVFCHDVSPKLLKHKDPKLHQPEH